MAQKKQQKQKAAVKTGALWRGKREQLRPSVLALVIVAGIALAIGGYFLQQGLGGGAAAPVASGLRINEVMSDNMGALVNEDAEAQDWIEIINAGGKSERLSQCALLLGSRVNDMYALPDVSLAPNECILIWAGGSLASGERNAPFKLSASGGETLMLLDGNGQPLDSVLLPEMQPDEAYVRARDGSWSLSRSVTPGRPNDSTAETASGVMLQAGEVEISEVMNRNGLWFADENGQAHDYVEIHNRTSHPVELGGWYLSDSGDKLKRWAFPRLTLPADGYLAVHCSGLNRTSNPMHLHTDFKLGSSGETVYLSRPDGSTVSMVAVPTLEPSQAYSLSDGAWTTLLAPTPGMENSQQAAAQLQLMMFGDGRGKLGISEVMTSATQQEYDWIELYNGTNQTIDLSNFGLSDKPNTPRKWQFPQGSSIRAGEYLLVCMSGRSLARIGNYVNADFALSAAGGYALSLCDPNGGIMDAIYLPRQYGGVSYGRSPETGELRYFEQATPGAGNMGASYLSRAAEASCSRPGGLFRSGEQFSVELSAPEGSRIYYTLDSSDPDQSDALYTGPIPISSTTILRSRVYRDGCMPSLTDTQSYLYDVQNAGGHYVVSLVSDMDNLTSADRGIIVAGNGARPNYMQEWEREAHFELFSSDGQSLLSQGCGISLHGQDSRKLPIKSFNVIARSAYGENRFRYPVFSQRDYPEYQSLLLRASGEDYNMSFMRDTLLSSLMRGSSVLFQEHEIAIVYIDGQYYTLCYIRERINPQSICQFEGWLGMEKEIDLVKGNDVVAQGSNESFAALLDWVKNNDTSSAAAYDYLNSQIDIRNYIEYMAIQIFSGNTDTLNVRRYRNPLGDGRWRWALFDLDWAFFTDGDSIGKWLTPGGTGAGKRTDNRFFIACMKNPRFRDEFLSYLGQQLATSFSSENVLAKIEERYAQIENELPQYLSRWKISLDAGIKKIIRYAQERPAKLLGYTRSALNLSDADMQKYFGDAIAAIRRSADGEVSS